MNETPAVIRQQMELTKLQLAEKLESLERQVSTTVRTTETAVTATMETVQSVTGAVHGAVDSVANLLNVNRHVEKHPWLIVGGAVIAGYLAAEFFTGKIREGVSNSGTTTKSTANQLNRQPVIAPLARDALIAVGHSAGTTRSTWNQFKEASIGSLIDIVPKTISRIIPFVVDRLIDSLSQPAKDSSSTPAEPENSREPSQVESHRLRIANYETLPSVIDGRCQKKV